MFNGDDEIKMRIENRDENVVYFLRNYCGNATKFDGEMIALDRLRNFIQYDYSIDLRGLVRSRIASSLALY